MDKLNNEKSRNKLKNEFKICIKKKSRYDTNPLRKKQPTNKQMKNNQIQTVKRIKEHI